MDLRIVAKHVGIFKSCEVAPFNVVYENYSTFPYKIQTTQIRYLIFIGRRSIIHKLCLLRTDENVCNTWAQYILFDRFRISKQCKSIGLDAHEMHPCKLQMHMHFTLSNKDSNAATFIKLLFIYLFSYPFFQSMDARVWHPLYLMTLHWDATKNAMIPKRMTDYKNQYWYDCQIGNDQQYTISLTNSTIR